MNVVGNSCSVRREQGFEVFVLSNHAVELAVVPELGARIISLKDLRTGREWLWHPACGRRLFRNDAGDSFETSPLVGLDECVPTIAPCSWLGRDLPDHGEVWAAAWTLDLEAWERGVLRTSVSLEISPLDFERTIELQENEIRVTLDSRNEKLGHKIREAQLQKIPYMLVIGDKELQAGAVAVRRRDGVDLGAMPLENFIQLIAEDNKTRRSEFITNTTGGTRSS